MIFQVLLIFYLSIVLHEFSHGWVANKCGDPTAKLSKRLSLNPIRHFDLFGTFLIPLVLKLANSPIIIGWPKPVPVNFRRLNHPKRDMMLVAAVGPLVNISIAVILSCLLKVKEISFLHKYLGIGVVMNLILAVFNLTPIPPLDGYRIVMSFLPGKIFKSYLHSDFWTRLEPFGIILIIIMAKFGLLDFIWAIVSVMIERLGVNAGILDL